MSDSPSRTILQEAEFLVGGDRNKDYGHPLDNFSDTAKVISAVLRKKLCAEVDEHDVVLIMIAVKLCREANKNKRDNLVDLCGYARCAEMCEEEKRRRCESISQGR